MTIGEVARFVQGRIEDAMQAEAPKSEAWTVLSNVVDPDGSMPEGVLDKLAMSLVSVQEDPSLRNNLPRRGEGDLPGPPALILTLHFTVAAVFTGAAYADGLSLLSRTLSFLAANPVLRAGDAPLPGGLDQLAIELVSLDFEEQHHVAAAVGLRGIPFAMFRVRGAKLA